MTAGSHRDAQGAKLGMWLFLFSELLLFGGLFLLYAVYLARYPADFLRAGRHLDLFLGTLNTVLLITSSLTVAMAFSALQMGRRTLCLGLLGGTQLAALLFLINKAVEWHAKFAHGLFPGAARLEQLPPGEKLFFGLYYLTTGLHGFHVLVGMGLLLWVLGLVRNGRVGQRDTVLLENGALYWHLVDLIWIFIFPLYYLLL